VRFQFLFLNCRELTQGSFWLSAYLNIRCWDPTHLRYVFTVAIPSVVAWGVGLPALCLLYIFRNRNKLALTFMKLRLGFIYNGYIVEKYYWEFVIIYRKILIISIAVFFTSVSIYVQALTVMIVILASLRLQNKHRPYIIPAMNDLEQRGVLVGGITIYCGLYSLTQGLDTPSQVVLFIILLGANVYFLSFWIYKVAAASWSMLMQRCKWLGNLLGHRYQVRPVHSSLQISSMGEKSKLEDSSVVGRLNMSWEEGDGSRVHIQPPNNSGLECEPASPSSLTPP